MSKAAVNLQDSFLNQVRRENSEVRVLLVNGTLLRGTVKGFDNFTLILNNRNGQHLIYKHAVAQIMTQRLSTKPDDNSNVESTPEVAVESPVGQNEEAAAPEMTKTSAEQSTHSPSSKGKSRREGFNKLDLSQVKLGDEKK